MISAELNDEQIREDQNLMQALVRQEPSALKRIHERYHRLLYSVAVSVVHDALDAEEILQDVFLHLWNRADTYSAERGKPLGWLVMLTRRRDIDRLRQQSSYRRATSRYETEVMQESENAPAEDRSRHQPSLDDLRALLKQQMLRLPPAQKQAVELTFFEGLSQREIASKEQLPLGTVKTRIELGLRKLANILLTARLEMT